MRVLSDPSQEERLRSELEEQLRDAEPHLCIAASRVLEVVAIGNLVKDARANPGQVQHIKSRLRALENTPEEHIKFAAREVLEEIEEIESEKD